ncbi:MAG: zinc metallopeptidase [Candidatus Eisenbacteria bacterium]|nr:zinc metallopeptidase [Candidatus Eisenbacteria bacterium]
MIPFFYDPSILLLIPALILAGYAQWKVRSAYARFSKVPSRGGRSGAEIARAILGGNGLGDVSVRETPGELSDHYDPRSRSVSLSAGNYRSHSIAAVGIAAHEVGHALQHGSGYGPLAFRHAVFPVANLGSTLAFPLFFIGFLMSYRPLIDLGILLFAGAVLFSLVTLPVEFNASRRAVAELERGGFLAPDELPAAREVLRAAALTYVAAATMAILQLLRLLILRGRKG